MADSIPAGWRTLWRPQRNAVRHDFGTLSAIAGTRPVAPAGRRGVSTQAFLTATLRSFCRGARRWPTRGLRCEKSKTYSAYVCCRRVELPAACPSDRPREDGGRRVPAAGERGGADELGRRREPRRGRARAATVPGDGEAGAPTEVQAATGLGVGARGTGAARPQGHADAAVDRVQGRAPRRL